MASNSRLKQWENFYATKFCPWHLEEVHPMLIKYASKIGLSTPKRVFVPLCGKSLDLKWLYDHGHSVVGLEGIELAVLEFSEIHKIDFDIQESSFGKVFTNSDGRLQIFVCDFLSVDVEELGKFDVIWDRGSFFACPLEDEASYVRLIKQFFGPDSRYLLMTMQYDESTGFKGPPRNVSFQKACLLFGDLCKLELLQVNDFTEEMKRLSEGKFTVTESYLLMTSKD